MEKYRGFSKELNKWVYGNLVKMDILINPLIIPFDSSVGHHRQFDEWRFGGGIEVILESVGEFTEWKIKEQDVYGGHIIREEYTNGYHNAIVKYWNYGWKIFIFEGMSYKYLVGFNTMENPFNDSGEKVYWKPLWEVVEGYDKYKIIGNQHENPELIK